MSADFPHVDDDIIAELQDLMAGDFEVLVSTFISDSTTRLQEIKQTLESSDPADFGKACHSLKGSATNVGVVRMAELCRQGELKGRQADWQGVTDILEEIETEFELIAELLQSKV